MQGEIGETARMNKSLRRSERFYNAGLWLVALVFAGCLAGLGGLVVDDLPQVEHQATRDDFLDSSAVKPLQASIRAAQGAQEGASADLDQANLKLQAAQQAYGNAKDAFGNWLETRKATNLPDQDAELVERTRQLDALKAVQVAAQRDVDARNQEALDAQQAQAAAQGKLDALNVEADRQVEREETSAELRVFADRLAVTVPLLAIAGWLFVRRRRSPLWPFVWGFILFALYAFCVELVPYLPSYGGYAYYGVGLVATVLVGRYTITALNGYLARQRAAEQQPDTVRRQELAYDTALARLGKSVCPGCERAVDLKTGENDFCPHCGIGLFNHCARCDTRKNAFSPFCHACGAPAAAEAARPLTTA